MAAVLIGLTATYMSSAKLLKDFEKNVETKEFVPEANSIEVSEIDTTSHRSWKIKAERSIGNSELTQVNSEIVEALVYDDEDNLKIKINSPKASADRNTGDTVLNGPAEVLMIEKNTKMIADKFIMKKGKPFEAIGHVKIFLSADGSKMVYAEKAIIAKTLDDITLYNVAESPVSPNMLVKGGEMNIVNSGSGKDSKPSRIIMTNGAWVKSGDTTCQSARLDVALDAGGNPSIATFTGSPVAIQKGTRIRATQIQYLVSTGTVKANGNVKTEII